MTPSPVPGPARRLAGALLALLLVLAPPAAAEEILGRVVAVVDGDTLTVLDGRRTEVRVRLSDIDTPERGQPWADRAGQALAELVFGREVRVDVRDSDRFGRTVGRVFVGAQDVNAEMVRRGNAWVFRRYSDDPDLLRLEAAAQAACRGLWSLPEAERVPPWEWRAIVRHYRLGDAMPVSQEGLPLRARIPQR